MHVTFFFLFIAQSQAQAQLSVDPLETPNEQNIKPVVYFDYLPFQQVLLEQRAINHVSGSSLLLAKELTPHVSRFEFLPTLRLLRTLETSVSPVCSMFKLKTQAREKNYIISKPVSFLSTNRLFVRADFGPINPDAFNEQGKIKSLQALFDSHPDSRLIYWRDISYGEYLDKQIAALPDERKRRVTGISSHGSLVRMLGHNRGDFAVMFPSEMQDYERENDSLELPSYEIHGVQSVSSGHLICNKTPESEVLITQANLILDKLYLTKNYIHVSTIGLNEREERLIMDAINRVK